MGSLKLPEGLVIKSQRFCKDQRFIVASKGNYIQSTFQSNQCKTLSIPFTCAENIPSLVHFESDIPSANRPYS